jgi:hypothetical protein
MSIQVLKTVNNIRTIIEVGKVDTNSTLAITSETAK